MWKIRIANNLSTLFEIILFLFVIFYCPCPCVYGRGGEGDGEGFVAEMICVQIHKNTRCKIADSRKCWQNRRTWKFTQSEFNFFLCFYLLNAFSEFFCFCFFFPLMTTERWPFDPLVIPFKCKQCTKCGDVLTRISNYTTIFIVDEYWLSIGERGRNEDTSPQEQSIPSTIMNSWKRVPFRNTRIRAECNSDVIYFSKMLNTQIIVRQF